MQNKSSKNFNENHNVSYFEKYIDTFMSEILVF